MSDNFIIGGQTRLQCESPLSLSLSLARHSGRLPFGSNRGSCQHHPKQLVVCQTCYTAPRNRNPVLSLPTPAAHPNNKRGGGININIRAMAVLTPSSPSLSSPPALRLKERRRLNRGGRKDQRNGDGDEEEEDEAGEGVGGWMRHLAQSAQ